MWVCFSASCYLAERHLSSPNLISAPPTSSQLSQSHFSSPNLIPRILVPLQTFCKLIQVLSKSARILNERRFCGGGWWSRNSGVRISEFQIRINQNKSPYRQKWVTCIICDCYCALFSYAISVTIYSMCIVGIKIKC